MESVNVFMGNISALQPIENSILLNEKFKPISNKIFIGYLESIKKINCMTLYSDDNTFIGSFFIYTLNNNGERGTVLEPIIEKE